MGKDILREASIELLHPLLTDLFRNAEKAWYEKNPHLPKPFISCTHRPNRIQQKLFEIGRSTPGIIVTNAESGESPHNYIPSFAFDIAFRNSDGDLDWSENLFINFATLILENGGLNVVKWGGDFRDIKDCPHFELDGWRTLICKREFYSK